MSDKRRGMILGSFAGDSLALGAHWVYNTADIDSKFGRVDRYLKPLPESYHPTKDRGDFTHYGDQTLVLLESVAMSKGFNLQDFSERWQSLFHDYRGYLDHATKGTLENFSLGKSPSESGSASTDLGGAARIAPLVLMYHDDPSSLVKYARAQTAMTHNTPEVLDSAEFFAGVAQAVLRGMSPVEALKAVGQECFEGTPLADGIEEGLDAAGMDSRKAVAQFGQSCANASAFPSVVQLIARHEEDLMEALVQNVMAGGDSAARGLLVGMVLGAHLGSKRIPPEWLQELRRLSHITALLESMEA